MPLFEYECERCYLRVERLVRFSADADDMAVPCPFGCKDPFARDFSSSQLMRRVPSVASFTLKGAGFHTNDYPRTS